MRPRDVIKSSHAVTIHDAPHRVYPYQPKEQGYALDVLSGKALRLDIERPIMSVMEDTPVKDLCALYSELLSANRHAFMQELFKVAYHALTGAMQCALELKDPEKMAEVGCLAHKQLIRLEAHFPESTICYEPTELTLYRSLVRLVDVRGFLLHYKNDYLY